jgi:branched-chain amino acid transport system ATP-binding protein
VLFQGKRISGMKPHTVARMGVVRTFQETTIFRNMNVRDNVIISHHLRSKANLFGFFINSKQARKDEASFRDSADEILSFLGLADLKDEIASNLPHGHLRALGIAIGLAAAPKILLLDEPFAGMNQDETTKAVKMIKEVRQRGVTLLVVEHDMKAVMEISDRIVVLNFGKKIAEGTPKQVQENKDVVESYLGKEDDDIGI